MLNWSIALRTQTTYERPKGPNFQRAPWTKIDIDGTQVKFKAPRSQSKLPVEVVNPDYSYDLSKTHTQLFGEGDYRWRSTLLMKRYWDFNGSWLVGDCGFIKMFALIMSPFNITEGLNFFHPRALENGVANYLTHFYGERFLPSNNEQMWLAPVNWQPQIHLPCIAARFDAVSKFALHDGPDAMLMLPISKHHILLLRCVILRNNVPADLAPSFAIDEWIDHKPFLELANQVLDSLEVTLSPEAKAQQEEALQGLQDKSLISEFPPLQWTKSDLALG